MSQQTKTHSHLVEIHTGSEVITYPLGSAKANEVSLQICSLTAESLRVLPKSN